MLTWAITNTAEPNIILRWLWWFDSPGPNFLPEDEPALMDPWIEILSDTCWFNIRILVKRN